MYICVELGRRAVDASTALWSMCHMTCLSYILHDRHTSDHDLVELSYRDSSWIVLSELLALSL